MPFTCHFCDCNLRPLPFRWFEAPLLLVVCRKYYCPHCGDSAVRPIRTFRNLFSGQRLVDQASHIAARAEDQAAGGSPNHTITGEGEPLRNRAGTSTRANPSRRHHRSTSERSGSPGSAKRTARELAAFTQDSAPDSYGRPSVIGRIGRRLRRIVRRILRRSRPRGRQRHRK